MAKISLNGWQRLWIVIGIIYACIVVTFTVLEFPKELTVSEYFGDADVEFGYRVPASPIRYVFKDDKWIEVKQIARNPDTGECVYLRDNEWSKAISCDALRQEKLPRMLTEEEIKILRNKQTKFIGNAAVWWVTPLVIIYIFGLGVAWVITGFHNRDEKSP